MMKKILVCFLCLTVYKYKLPNGSLPYFQKIRKQSSPVYDIYQYPSDASLCLRPGL